MNRMNGNINKIKNKRCSIISTKLYVSQREGKRWIPNGGEVNANYSTAFNICDNIEKIAPGGIWHYRDVYL